MPTLYNFAVVLLGVCFGEYVTNDSMFRFLKQIRWTFRNTFSGLVVSMVAAKPGSTFVKSVPISLLVRLGWYDFW